MSMALQEPTHIFSMARSMLIYGINSIQCVEVYCRISFQIQQQLLPLKPLSSFSQSIFVFLLPSYISLLNSFRTIDLDLTSLIRETFFEDSNSFGVSL